MLDAMFFALSNAAPLGNDPFLRELRPQCAETEDLPEFWVSS